MATVTLEQFVAWVEALEGRTYYEILNVDPATPYELIKRSFHSMALTCHPDNFSEEEPALSRAASAVFKRGVEAYQVLSQPALRARYDQGLSKGRARLDEHHISTPPPPPMQRTLEMIAKTPKAKGFAIKADRLLSAGRLEDARLQLINACQQEPGNAELAERLTFLWEALALEPL